MKKDRGKTVTMAPVLYRRKAQGGKGKEMFISVMRHIQNSFQVRWWQTAVLCIPSCLSIALLVLPARGVLCLTRITHSPTLQDTGKQEAINLFLGLFVPLAEEADSSTPVVDIWDLASVCVYRGAVAHVISFAQTCTQPPCHAHPHTDTGLLPSQPTAVGGAVRPGQLHVQQPRLVP